MSNGSKREAFDPFAFSQLIITRRTCLDPPLARRRAVIIATQLGQRTAGCAASALAITRA
jgi:hypothetical protein